jgi:hypothetical protein
MIFKGERGGVITPVSPSYLKEAQAEEITLKKLSLS